MNKRLLRVLVIFVVISLFLSQAIQPVFAKDLSGEKYPVYPTVYNFSMRFIAAQEAILDFYSDSPGTYYYLVYESSASAPDINSIKAQADGIAKGTGLANPGLNSINITSLAMQTGYVAYIIVDNARNSVSYLSNIGGISFTTKNILNTAPNRKSSVLATKSVDVQYNTDFRLNLLDIFEDIDSDNLVFSVNIKGKRLIRPSSFAVSQTYTVEDFSIESSAAADYSYDHVNILLSQPILPFSYTFTFIANDLWKNSTDTYTVTVNYYKDFPGGSGTVNDPYLITEPKHLDSMRYFSNMYFRLANDIDLSGYTSSNCTADKGWKPISDFTGFLDGGEEHHTISNLYINRGSESYVGLFASIYWRAKITNIGLKNVNISGYNYVGGLIGRNGINTYNTYSLDITNCYVTGSVNGNNYIGGIIGYNDDLSNVTDCYMTGSVTGNTYVGGITGSNKSKISKSFSAANIKGSMYTGGIGGANNGTISKCYSDSLLINSSQMGGIAGINNGQIDNCYFSGRIKGSTRLGGIIGVANSYSSAVTYCYSTGKISGTNYTGALIGYGRTIPVTGSYWDKEYSDVWTTYMNLGTDKTTLEMKTKATFQNWDFNSIWSMDGTINDGYPYLSWQNTDALKTHIVIFKDHDGTVLKTETVGHGKSATAPVEPLRTGYVFEYWDLTYTNIAADISITAVYRKSGMSNPYWPASDIDIEVSDVTYQDAKLSFSSDLIGVYYYFIIPASDAFIDILDYRPATGGLIELLETNTISLTGLFGLTQYDVYIVIENFDGNIQDVAQTSFKTEDYPNNLPNRRSDIQAEQSVSLEENETFTLNLDSIFTDMDGDALTYYVSVNNSSYTYINSNYSFNETEYGSYTLQFKANDREADSEDTYIVKIFVNPKVNTDLDNAELTVTVDKNENKVKVEIKKDTQDSTGDKKDINIEIPEVPGIKSYSLTVSTDNLNNSEDDKTITIQTPTADLSIPGNMLSNMEGISDKKAEISVSSADKSSLSAAARLRVGSRPLIELSLSIDDAVTAWSNPDAPVTVTIPYEPTELEKKNPDSIIVWYIDGKGDITCISNGRYLADKGVVTFEVTHFSNYSIGYSNSILRDVPETAEYYDAMNFVVARKIMAPTGYNLYSPDAYITRAEFLVMLMKTYNIASDTDITGNFIDAGNEYYTGYLSAAKRLGLSSGVGDNKFEPNAVITKQEAFTFLYKVLVLINKLPDCTIQKSLNEFNDGNSVAQWAREPIQKLIAAGIVDGSENTLVPYSNITREEFAQIIYNLLKMQ